MYPLYDIFHGFEHRWLIHGLLDIRRLRVELLNQDGVSVDQLEGAPPTLLIRVPLLRLGVT